MSEGTYLSSILCVSNWWLKKRKKKKNTFTPWSTNLVMRVEEESNVVELFSLLTFHSSNETKAKTEAGLRLCLCSTVSLFIYSTSHTGTGINGMAQCRQTQSSCKAPTPRFFAHLYPSLIAHLHSNLQISLFPTWQTTNQQFGIHSGNRSARLQWGR